MADSWLDQRIKQTASQLRTPNEAVAFAADPDGTGDISGETPVTVYKADAKSKFLVQKQPLADVLKQDGPAKIIRGVFANYGLTPADLDHIATTPDPNERKLLAHVHGLSDRNSDIRIGAIRELTELGGDTAWNALSGRAIYDPAPRVRVAAVDALATLNLPKAVPILAVVQSHDPAREVKEKIAATFAKAIAEKKITEEDIQTTVRPPYRGLISYAHLHAESERFFNLMNFRDDMKRTSRDPVFK